MKLKKTLVIALALVAMTGCADPAREVVRALMTRPIKSEFD